MISLLQFWFAAHFPFLIWTGLCSEDVSEASCHGGERDEPIVAGQQGSHALLQASHVQVPDSKIPHQAIVADYVADCLKTALGGQDKEVIEEYMAAVLQKLEGQGQLPSFSAPANETATPPGNDEIPDKDIIEDYVADCLKTAFGGQDKEVIEEYVAAALQKLERQGRLPSSGAPTKEMVVPPGKDGLAATEKASPQESASGKDNASTAFAQAYVASSCPWGQVWRRKPWESPRGNGCGPASSPEMTDFGNVGLHEMKACCNQHDLHYAECGKSQWEADNAFANCVRSACNSRYGRRRFWRALRHPDCVARAEVAIFAVSNGGSQSHAAAQQKFCHCA
eukprot:CAMPEP_0179052928 /NCGR_PEP_ID=MMETSP0796-20121207/22007_1 /TAXON_ID=73915 /ORGANISM="Pyrodinium bahamense, Strain pbaha01" /LENGTH=337 /DNA_ID=CAMNT_0020749503 /DNA_START=39 /DNA_END=1052 /DNA_ORIENTATION=+